MAVLHIQFLVQRPLWLLSECSPTDIRLSTLLPRSAGFILQPRPVEAAAVETLSTGRPFSARFGGPAPDLPPVTRWSVSPLQPARSPSKMGAGGSAGTACESPLRERHPDRADVFPLRTTEKACLSATTPAGARHSRPVKGSQIPPGDVSKPWLVVESTIYGTQPGPPPSSCVTVRRHHQISCVWSDSGHAQLCGTPTNGVQVSTTAAPLRSARCDTKAVCDYREIRQRGPARGSQTKPRRRHLLPSGPGIDAPRPSQWTTGAGTAPETTGPGFPR